MTAGGCVPRQIRTLAGIAQLNSWYTIIGDNQLTACHSDHRGIVVWSAVWNDHGIAYLEHRVRTSRREPQHRNADHTPVVAHRTTLARLRALAGTPCTPNTADVCVCCNTSSAPETAHTTSGAGLCQACHRTHLELAEQGATFHALPHPGCATRGHGNEHQVQ